MRRLHASHTPHADASQDGSTPVHLRGTRPRTPCSTRCARDGGRSRSRTRSPATTSTSTDSSRRGRYRTAQALEHEDVLRETARIGDFRELRVTRGRGDDDGDGDAFGMWSETTAALRLCAWIIPSNARSSRGRSRETSTASPRASTRTSCLVADALNAVEPRAGSTADADDAAAERAGCERGAEVRACWTG